MSGTRSPRIIKVPSLLTGLRIVAGVSRNYFGSPDRNANLRISLFSLCELGLKAYWIQSFLPITSGHQDSDVSSVSARKKQEEGKGKTAGGCMHLGTRCHVQEGREWSTTIKTLEASWHIGMLWYMVLILLVTTENMSGGTPTGLAIDFLNHNSHVKLRKTSQHHVCCSSSENADTSPSQNGRLQLMGTFWHLPSHWTKFSYG